MPLVTIVGSVALALEKEEKRLAKASTDAAHDAKDVYVSWIRGHTRAGFAGGSRMDRAWTGRAYPDRRYSIAPSAIIFVRGDFDYVMAAFDKPATVRGRFFPSIVIPTFWAQNAGLKPDNTPNRGRHARFVKGAVGRNWVTAAEAKWGLLKYIPSANGEGWLVAESGALDGYPIFKVTRQSQLKKRINIESQFSRMRRDWPAAIANAIATAPRRS